MMWGLSMTRSRKTTISVVLLFPKEEVVKQLEFGLEYEIAGGPDRAELFANQIGDDQHRQAIWFAIRQKTRPLTDSKVAELLP